MWKKKYGCQTEDIGEFQLKHYSDLQTQICVEERILKWSYNERTNMAAKCKMFVSLNSS